LGLKIFVRSQFVFATCALALLVAVVCAHSLVHGEARKRLSQESISVTSTYANTWQQDRETVYLLRGQCQIVQGGTTMRAERVVVWRRPDPRSSGRDLITVYLENGVRVDEPGNTLSEPTLLRELSTVAGIEILPQRPVVNLPGVHDPTYQRGLAQRTAADKSTIHPAQFESGPRLPEPQSEIRVFDLRPATGGIRRVRFFGRNGGSYSLDSYPTTNTTPPEQVVILKNGVTVLIDTADGPGGDSRIGVIDLSADQVVFWSDEASLREFNGTGEVSQPQEMPFQIYLEGNIVVRQGANMLKAKQAFYDVREERALLVDSEVRARVPGTTATVRIRAQTLRQLARDTYHAENAFITTSQYFKPGYRIAASSIHVEPRAEEPWWLSNVHEIDPNTGEPEEGPTLWATSLNNTFFVEDVPVFYLPYLSVPAEDPNIPIREIGYQSDRIFGQTIRTRWDIFKLTGLDRPAGTRWDLNLNYMTYRGPQFGTIDNYQGTGRFGLAGPYVGSGYQSIIFDHGNDNLGADRRSLIPPHETRGGLLQRDRQDFTPNTSLLSELSFLSDRNWLEQYREQEFDTGKDYESLLYLRHLEDNWSWSGMGRVRLYNYYNTTNWLPRGDLFGLAEPLFGGLLTWSSHTYAGYANQRIANQPTDPNDLYTVLPFEGNGNGLVAATRHEIDMPFQIGPVNFVPYALGEEAFWGDAFHNIDSTTPIDGRIFGATQVNEGSLNRLYGSLGMRGSFEMWRVYPTVQSDMFNLNGLAHKMVFDADYSFSESNQDLASIPQYNEFDDNSQEQFRRRLLVNTWGGTLPAQFEPRFFAVRSGSGASVTAPYNELVDNMNVLRLGWRHRLQTKVGPVNAPRIKNWMTLDLGVAYFPDYKRDNFGEPFGLYSARYNWYVGDRTTVVASTLFDTFDNPEKLWSFGINSQRSTRGSVYVGLRNISGGSTLHSEILTASYSYVMSPKWISSASTAYDLGEHQNRGQTLMITRVGSDFLINFGLTADPMKNNFSLALSIEPRFGNFGIRPNTGSSPGSGAGFSGFGSSGLGSLLNGPPDMGVGPVN
jgi:lipopolysaccharide export system protein LptA